MADPQHALVPYLHIPLQAGADRTLARMRRKYSRRAFLDFVCRAHNRVPGIGIGTDVLAGFPGETDEEFDATRDLLLESPLFYAHVFKYSERPGTASARMPDKIPAQEIDRRAAELRNISARKTRLFQEHHLGKQIDVLFEETDGGRWIGHAGNYLRAAVPTDQSLTGHIATVRVDGIEDDTLVGRLAPDVPGTLERSTFSGV
jgi:threonylcarbamoyladenosine tRNA methylthiotransferase MtaB